jgi:TonB family protein
MPYWNPAIVDGKKVRCYHSIKVEYTPSANHRKKNLNTIFGENDVYGFVNTEREGYSAAVFQDGQLNTLIQWLATNIKYPTEARENNEQGKVKVRFVIERDGSISIVEIMESSGSELLDNEAIRVVGTMPTWIPAQVEGKPVRSYSRVPIIFKLGN